MSQPKPDDFIAALQRLAAAEDRAALADLRHGVADASASRAWPHIAPFCDLRKPDELAAHLVVGAGFAMHEATDANAGNLGSTLRRIAVEGKEGNRDEALNSFAARFRRLLACDSTQEVCRHLPGILRAAARIGIPVNYSLLLRDLLKWNGDHENIKLRWAQAYWGSETAAKGGESA